MASEMVERVARALCFAPGAREGEGGQVVLERCCECSSADDCYEINGPLRNELVTQATAAIEEMGAPTAAMVIEMSNYLPITPGGATDRCAARIWGAGVRKALEETDRG